VEALIQVRRGTAAQWLSANPVLAPGEPGMETDTGKGKYGNGSQNWTALPYSWSIGGPIGAAGGALEGSYPDPTLADDSVGSAQIVDGSVGSAELGTDAVTTAKIGNLQVTGGKLADSAVSLAKLGPGAVDSTKIVDGSIGLGDLNSGTVSSLKADVYDEGTSVVADVSIIDFVGSGVTVDTPSGGRARVTVSGSGTGTTIPPGAMMQWHQAAAPAGWYACNGGLHVDMAPIIGTEYGAVAGTVPTIQPTPCDTGYSGTNVYTTVAGWAVDSAEARIRKTMVILDIQVHRTGAAINLNFPEFTDQNLCNLKNPLIPEYELGGGCSNVPRWYSITTGGAVNLTAGLSDSSYTESDVATGDVIILHAVYNIAAAQILNVPRIYWIIKAP